MTRSDGSLGDFVSTLPLFQGLPAVVTAMVAARATRRSVPRGELIFMSGDTCKDLYVLVEGQVMCYVASAEGREQVIKIFGKSGDLFCMTGFSLGRHVVSARAARMTRLLTIDVQTLTGLASQHSLLALRLASRAGSETAAVIRLTENLALRKVIVHLASILRDRALAIGTRTSPAIELDRSELREEDLASMVGSVRVHVSRSLKELARIGAIQVSRKAIRIRDLSMLERLCGEEPACDGSHVMRVPRAGTRTA